MKSRILLVDDEPRNLSLLEALLLPLGYDTRAATDGKRALELFASERPDLVLLDFEMPGLSGLHVLESIRADKEYGDVPVIMVTGHAEREHRLRAVEAGVDEFLEKPIDLTVLR
ncbi:response regulator, partial [bacterium]